MLHRIDARTAALYRGLKIDLEQSVAAPHEQPGTMQMLEMTPQSSPAHAVEEIDRARAREYALLAILLSRGPDAEMIGHLALLRGDDSPLGQAHASIAEAAGRGNEESAAREYFDLFAGLGQGQLLPYSSHYLTGSLYSRPLARLREVFRHLGIERATSSEPEDHIAILCEIMAGLIGGDFAAAPGADREFFETQLAPWARHFFVDLEHAKSADFYARIGSLGRIFMEIEARAYSFAA
jgi:TorA maturation chaperone TorD